jgi:ATP-dependent DNA helicase DinG
MTLEEQFDSFVQSKHPLFGFRPQQRDVILDMIRAYDDDPNGVFLLDAPTGSGKSIIAMLFSDFMNHRGQRGYVLASDLSLHEQYIKDFRRLQNWNWGNIKGIDNYECEVNGEKFSTGHCASRGMSYEQAEKLECFKKCGYLQARKKAIRAPLSLLTYPYALIQRNYVEQQQQGTGRGVPFPQRDFVICDEAHKLLDIVQNHFSPIITTDIQAKVQKILDIMIDNGLPAPKIDLIKFDKIVKSIFSDENESSLLENLTKLVDQLSLIVKANEKTKDTIAEEFGDNDLSADLKQLFRLTDWCKDCHCKFEDYVAILNRVGVHKMIKNPADKHIVFNCIDEYYLLQRHFYNKFGFKVLMTATMGNPKDFMRNHGLKSAKYFKMDSHFAWEKSPIIFYPGKKLSARHLEDNIGWAIEKTVELLTTHQDQRGIIHTGSYELGERVWSKLPREIRKRVLTYKGSEEKDKIIKKLKKNPNTVIMGPSLLEGLNLADDDSRFQIFLKVPYPHLGDRYVKAKLEDSQKWYNWKTSISVLQGAGRSIRTPDDWAVTYLLDGNFADLLKAAGDQFPPEFKRRLVVEYK